MIETQIIKTFCLSRESYERYYKYVKLDYIKINYSNIYKIFNTIHSYYNKYEDKELITKEELDLSYNSNYLLKEQERKEVSTLIDTVFKAEITNSDAVIELLDEHRKRSLAGDIARISLDVEEGTASLDDLHKIYAEFDQASIEIEDSAVVDMSLADLYQSQVATQGLRWRLKWLNQSLGSLRKGDFGFIFARPETGKTTFLASEVTQMIQQTEGNIVWFNIA